MGIKYLASNGQIRTIIKGIQKKNIIQAVNRPTDASPIDESIVQC